MNKTAPLSLYTRVSSAAEHWRVMLKHVVDLKASRLSASVSPTIKKLYDALTEAPLSSHPPVADGSNVSSRASSPCMPSGSHASSLASTPRSSDGATMEAAIPRNQDGFPDFRALDVLNPQGPPGNRAGQSAAVQGKVQYVSYRCRCPDCDITICLDSDSDDGATLKQQNTSSASHVEAPEHVEATNESSTAVVVQTPDAVPPKQTSQHIYFDSDDELAKHVQVPNPKQGAQRISTLGHRPTPKKKGKGKQSTPPTTKPELKKRRISNKSHGESTAHGPPKSTELEPAGHAPTADQQSMPTETDPAGEAGQAGNAGRVKKTRITPDLHQILKLPVNVHERFTAGKEFSVAQLRNAQVIKGCARPWPRSSTMARCTRDKIAKNLHTRQDLNGSSQRSPPPMHEGQLACMFVGASSSGALHNNVCANDRRRNNTKHRRK